jgi:hypothetical protein
MADSLDCLVGQCFVVLLVPCQCLTPLFSRNKVNSELLVVIDLPEIGFMSPDFLKGDFIYDHESCLVSVCKSAVK